MKRIAIMLVFALILLFTPVLSGCGGKGEEATPTPVHTVTATPTKVATITPAQTQTSIATPTATSTTIKTQTPTSTPIPTATLTKTATPASTTGKSLANIYGEGIDIGPVKYDQTMIVAGAPPMTQTVWLKGAWSDKMKMRYESTMGMATIVTLIDLVARTFYTYYPQQNLAYSSDLANAPTSPVEGSEQIEPTYLGDETIDGKDCSIYEWNQAGAYYKAWMWKDHPLPIKTEFPSLGKTVITEYTNIVFGDIPDSMFQLPEGVQITTMPK